MGAGNYFYHSAIMEQKQTEQYTQMVYVDEYGYGAGESAEDFGWVSESMRSNIRELLHSKLKGFELAQYPFESSMLYQGSYHSDGNEEVLGYIGRMAVIAASSYDGDRVAIVIVPNEEWQRYIWGVETDPNQYLIDWRYYGASERACWASAIRSIQCGGLSRELLKVSNKVIALLKQHIGAERLSFRTSAWTSVRYCSQAVA